MPTVHPSHRAVVVLGLAIALLLPAACASRRDRQEDTQRADIPEAPPAPSPPAPVTMTPVRFDAYLLAVRNIRAAHPAFVESGSNPEAVREEMRDAVGRAGLTLEEFKGLHAQVQADPFLKAEAQHRLAAPPPQSGATPPPPPPPLTAPTPRP